MDKNFTETSLKKKMILTILICLALFTTGCTGRADSETTQESGKISESNETQALNETQTSNETPTPVTRPKILETAVPVGEDGVLSYIPNSYIEENLMQEITIFQNQLLSSYYIYDTETNADILHLRLLSLDSGNLLYETELQTAGSYAVAVQVCENQIVVSDAQSGIIHVFDETLNETRRYEASGNTIYVNTSVTEAYCLTGTDGIHILNLENNEERIILDNTSELSFYSCSGNDISIRYIDLSAADKKECYAGLNLDTGKIEKFEIDDSFSGMEYHMGVWASELLASSNTYFIGTQQEPYRFSLELSYPSMKLVGNPARLILTTTDSDGTQAMAAYETDGTFLSSCSLKDISGTLMSTQVWLKEAEGYLFIIIDNTGHDQLYFWDLSKVIDGDALALVSYYQKEELGGEILEQRYYARAEALSEKYGATIKIADQCSTDYGDKTAEQECDPDKVTSGLDVLEKALSSYPDGFFGQLYYGAYRTMEINLMGEITNKEEIEGHTPTAFVQNENGKIRMVLNIFDSANTLEQNFYHESSHIIDKVLEHDAFYRDDALYSEETWWTLNPEEFIALNPENGGYYGSYEIMPMEYYQEIFTPYFAADYGKSFSTEDRATVFEAAMIGTYQIFSPQVSYPLYAKLEYYCRCIRDCFDTTDWPEYTAWEAALRDSGSYYEK